MGIVIKQGSKNAVFTYLGFLIGAIYTALLVPKVFAIHPEYWGAARLLVSYAVILAPLAMLGTPMAIIRFFPIFKGKDLQKFLFTAIFWTLLGLIITSLLVFLLSNWWFTDVKNQLFNNNAYLIIPILVGYVLLELTSAIARSIYKTVLAVALKEFAYRLIILISVLLFWADFINFQQFLILYSLAYLLVFIPLLIFLLGRKEVSLKIDFSFVFSKKMNKVYIYSLFTIISASAFMFLSQIDSIMIGKYLSLKEVAIYGPSLFIATTIMVPSRSIMAIVNPMVAKAWATDSFDTIKDLYKKTSIAPLTITIFLFLLIWINIDLIMYYYGKDFGQGKYIVLFISIGNIINISTGINGTIINTSKYYKADIVFQLLLIMLTVITNIVLIPKYGINGAALATGITILLHNIIKLIYVYYIFNIHPFSIKTILIIIIGLIFFVVINYIDKPNSLLLSSFVFTIIISVIYPLLVYKLHISDDINNIIDKSIKKLKSK